MVQGGARQKHDFIQEHCTVDQNLSVAQSHHDSHNVGQSPQEQICQLIACKCWLVETGNIRAPTPNNLRNTSPGKTVQEKQ